MVVEESRVVAPDAVARIALEGTIGEREVFRDADVRARRAVAFQKYSARPRAVVQIRIARAEQERAVVAEVRPVDLEPPVVGADAGVGQKGVTSGVLNGYSVKRDFARSRVHPDRGIEREGRVHRIARERRVVDAGRHGDAAFDRKILDGNPPGALNIDYAEIRRHVGRTYDGRAIAEQQDAVEARGKYDGTRYRVVACGQLQCPSADFDQGQDGGVERGRVIRSVGYGQNRGYRAVERGLGRVAERMEIPEGFVGRAARSRIGQRAGGHRVRIGLRRD